MASILRTGKFLRYFAGFTRNVVVNTVREPDSSSLLQNTTCLCTQFQNGFANGPAAALKADLSLDKQIKRLDQDVRRMGRISRRDIEDVLEEIRTQRSATSSQSLLVIRCCGNLVPEELPEVRTALVQEIWKTLNALNVPMDISHYNALLRVYLENEHEFSPADFLAEIESKSIEPNRVTYQRLIARYCQQGDIDGATRILEHMRAKNLPVNEAVFNSLILGHSQAGDMESAKGILSVMKQAGLEPSADTYTTLLCCYAKHGDMESINNTLAECEKNEILLLDKDILDVIYNLAVNGHGDKIDGLLTKFHRSAGFNQDCANIILRLTNNGYEDVCLKLLRIMPRGNRPDGTPVDVGTFFIRQLVKANRPVEKILSVCKVLQDEGLNTKALMVATEAGLTHGLVNSTLPLLTEMKNAGIPVRQHYFWPLICSVEPNQIVGILRKMQEEFNMPPSAETIRDYVIPNLKEKNSDKIITLLRDVGVANGTAAAATCCAALANNQIKEAATIMENYNATYNIQTFRQPLIQAFGKVQNYDAFVQCARQLYESAQKKSPNATTSAGTKSEQTNDEAETEELDLPIDNKGGVDVVGDLVVDVTSYFRTDRVKVLERLLPKLVQTGFTISNQNAEKISDKLGSEMTTAISENLGKLSSGELELVPLKNAPKKRGLESLTVEELERFISNLEAKGENTNHIKRHLLNACFRSKKLEKTLEVFERLQKENYSMGSGIYAQLIDLYTYHERVSDAIETYNKIKAKEPEFRLDNLKTVGIVEVLLKEERFDDALKFLDENKKSQPVDESENNYTNASKVWRILNGLAETGNADKLQKMFDAFVKGNFILPTNVILGPLIKVHLVNDNIPKAMEAFEKLCDEYKSTPWKNELARRLIQAEDANNLQKLTDLSTNIHGEINSLYDLVFSFVECGRVRQARKILETPGLRTRPHRIDTACERYKKEGMVEPLEGLIEATRDLNHIDRNKIYYSLLQSYCKTEDTDKALGLWTKMQEENITPNDDFLVKLAELLESKNIPVPFVVETKQTKRKSKIAAVAKAAEESVKKPVTASEKSAKKPEAVAKPAEPKTPSNISLLRKALKNNDLEAALEAKNKLNANEQPSLMDTSHLIEQLVRAGRLSEATKYVNEMLASKLYPLPKVFKFYLNRIANSGDLETMQMIGQQLNEEQKRVISFDNRYCHANIVAGKGEQYFKKLSDDLAATKTPEEVAKLAETFPRGGALGILDKHPELEDQFQKLAESYAKHNQLGPMNVLWIHHISKGNEAVSKSIWEKYLSSAPRLMFQRVLQTARDQNDDKLAESVISQLRDSKISEGAIGNAYSCLIDIQTAKGNSGKALETLKTAIKDVCLEHINRTALLRLKTALEAEKKEFPYTIPEKKATTKGQSSSSSSSSSDDDVSPKRPETRPTKPSQKDA
ncbi:leucine-rich PPR motif-containing protein, mitochondrial [Musca domestica]|uniref:Leucine-rich PPR motif-containing protein, mitochondrial n=1 Tax=Musca domestica TaxID=7370 RepID=T1PDQ1_MUSDO|nr:leucine-rich PPR motif-containing protein, mitochondrial [Musca domestica]